MASQMKGFIAFAVCLAFADGHILNSEYKQQWQAWKTFYDKKYSTDTEEEARYAIWRDNLRVSCKCIFSSRIITHKFKNKLFFQAFYRLEEIPLST